jgi:hypothetical protein
MELQTDSLKTYHNMLEFNVFFDDFDQANEFLEDVIDQNIVIFAFIKKVELLYKKEMTEMFVIKVSIFPESLDDMNENIEKKKISFRKRSFFVETESLCLGYDLKT